MRQVPHRLFDRSLVQLCKWLGSEIGIVAVVLRTRCNLAVRFPKTRAVSITPIIPEMVRNFCPSTPTMNFGLSRDLALR
jgi:hypothetical protein